MFQNRDIRELVRIIARYSDLSRPVAETLYKKYDLFANKRDWQAFLNVALLAMGCGFALAGVIFFFAYNWEDLPKAVKIGSMEVLVLATALYAIFSKKNRLVRDISLFAASVLTGAMFAVYGQIYQTGADAYDFFLGWGGAILLWSLFSGFSPLWMLQLVIFNLVVWLYGHQMTDDRISTDMLLLLFFLNVLPLLLMEALHALGKLPSGTQWMVKTLAVASVLLLTSGAITTLFEMESSNEMLFWVSIMVLYPLAIWYSFRQRQLFYLVLVPLSVIAILSTLLVKNASDAGIFFITSIFIVGSISALTYGLIQLNRKWHEINEEPGNDTA